METDKILQDKRISN